MTFGICYHQFDDDTQLYTVIDAKSHTRLATLSSCADAVTGWHIRNDILLNSTKTEAITTGTRQQIARLYRSGGVVVSGAVVPFGSTMRVLGVTRDSAISFDEHITGVVRVCNYHLRALRNIRHLIDREAANATACSIVGSRLDYCRYVNPIWRIWLYSLIVRQ